MDEMDHDDVAQEMAERAKASLELADGADPVALALLAIYHQLAHMADDIATNWPG